MCMNGRFFKMADKSRSSFYVVLLMVTCEPNANVNKSQTQASEVTFQPPPCIFSQRSIEVMGTDSSNMPPNVAFISGNTASNNSIIQIISHDSATSVKSSIEKCVDALPTFFLETECWNSTQACTIINSIEHRLSSRPHYYKEFIPLLHNIKRHLVDFERTLESEKDAFLRPVSLKETVPSNRDFINRKETTYHDGKLNTFNGQKVIDVHDDVEDSIPSKFTEAERICRPGPLHSDDQNDESTTDRKCLIMGDSISIGYHDYVADMLEGECIVHHAPWAGDGGSLDTRYILKCLPLFLSSSVYEPVHYDAIIFNSGLHDVNCCNFPREYVPLKKYVKNLKKIKKTLLQTGAMVAFATSTPVPFNRTINKRLQKYNKAAIKTMKDHKRIKIIDLYKALVKECDGVALRKCDKFQHQPNVHLTGDGYLTLANEVIRGFKSLLKKVKPKKKGLEDSKQVNVSRDSKYCIQQIDKKMQDIHRLTGCPANTTCCVNEYSNSFIGCCMLEDAMDCGDSWHCCPKGTVCDPSCSMRNCSCRKAPWESKASRSTFSILLKSLNVFWNKLTKKYT